MKKDINLSIVKYAALFLIESEGSTTTLDVKNLLRDYDFKASQSDVSELLDQAASELPLEYDVGSKYRTYKMPTLSTVVASNTLNGLIPNVSTTSLVVDAFNTAKSPLPAQRSMTHKVTYTRKDGDQLILSKDRTAYSAFAWRITSTQNDAVLYYNYDTSRDDVRQAYASIYKVPFHCVRACLDK